MVKQKRDRYEMHKYWGKKPSGDLKALIERYSEEGDTLLDPFSGYGVFCCEAFILNRNVISNDLNPVANFINSQLLERDINLDKLQREWVIIKNEFIPFVNKWFQYTLDGEKVDLINVLRDNNDIPIKARYKKVGLKKTQEILFSTEQSQEYIRFEKDQIIDDWFPITELIENSRISAKKGMTVANLFTKRTLACHAKLLSLIENISTGNEKNLFKLAFTANLANCSKLVPPIKTRGDMSQGAWMTGFYIGETYIENNVLQYFENRFNKIIKGKKDYLNFFENRFFTSPSRASYTVTQFDAKKLNIPGASIDYIFTDPPYGGAVPYFEQSIIWNSWLKLSPDYKNEIVVSDSKERNKSIEFFEDEIFEAIREIRRVLKTEGYFSITYHSLSGAEWKSITNACLKNGFDMVDFSWLVQKTFTPRQISRQKGIRGDVLITFRKSKNSDVTNKSDSQLEKYFIDNIQSWLHEESLDTNDIFLRIMKMVFSEKLIIGNIDLYEILNKNFDFTEDLRWSIKHELEFA